MGALAEAVPVCDAVDFITSLWHFSFFLSPCLLDAAAPLPKKDGGGVVPDVFIFPHILFDRFHQLWLG